MSNKNLFQEAIADAKSVREAALANAKAALEEALTPRLQSMLAAKLNEMEYEEEGMMSDEEMEEGFNTNSFGWNEEDQVNEDLEGDLADAEEDVDESEEDFDLSEILAELNEAEEAEEAEETEEEEETEDEESEEEVEVKDLTIEELKDLIKDIVSQEMGAEEASDDDMDAEMGDMGDEDGEEEINLDELLAELDALGEGDDEKPMKNSKPLNESLESILGVLAGVAGIGLSGVAIAKAQEILKEKNPKLYKKLQDIGSTIEKAKGLGEGDDTEEKSKPLNESLAVLAGLAAMGLLGVSVTKAQELLQKKNPELYKKLQGIGSSIEKAKGLGEGNEEKKEMKEAIATIKTLRNELNEVNLLNAKLLYLNKIFKSKNLTESQKVHVIASFDKATNVKETKVVFESLNTALVATKKPIKESLGFASKAAGIAPSKQLIVESNDAITRMQKLANIIK